MKSFKNLLVEHSYEDIINSLSSMSKQDNELVIYTNKILKDNDNISAYVSNEYWTDDNIKQLNNENIKIDKLTATQDIVYVRVIYDKIKSKSKELPVVVKYKNKNYLVDGHHTVISEYIKNSKTVIVEIYKFT